ncbi:prolyl oligopeptidase family serine peptidase [bacterium]|nr:prolyl oligopeptidase family serine peptidase [bacterium]
MKTLVIVLSGLCLAAFAVVASADDVPRQQVKRLDVQTRVQLDYLLSLPKDYEQKESWPLLLFLHGAGERGDSLELVKKHGPPKLIAAGHEFPFIVASPQCPKDRWWREYELVALLDDLAAKYNVDEDRVYVTGLSMGGFGTWYLAAYAPERIAAIAPICGGGDRQRAKYFANVAVWAFHGAKDTGVLPERSEEMIEALKEAGSEPKLTIYPEAGHDAWTATYGNPKLYEWLLGHKRQPPEEKSKQK